MTTGSPAVMLRSLVRRAWMPLGCWLLLAGALSARTIVLTDDDCPRMAAIAAEAPRLGWAATEMSPGSFMTYYLDLIPTRGFLIYYPLDRIPKGQKVTNAEWEIPVSALSAGEPRLYVRRIVGDWGVGVCHEYRSVRPTKVPWNVPGAKGASLDRALKPTAVVRMTAAGPCTINVTEDVQLWNSGAAANQGWILNVEDVDSLIRLNLPMYQGRGQWKLRITYEPE